MHIKFPTHKKVTCYFSKRTPLTMLQPCTQLYLIESSSPTLHFSVLIQFLFSHFCTAHCFSLRGQYRRIKKFVFFYNKTKKRANIYKKLTTKNKFFFFFFFWRYHNITKKKKQKQKKETKDIDWRPWWHTGVPNLHVSFEQTGVPVFERRAHYL